MIITTVFSLPWLLVDIEFTLLVFNIVSHSFLSRELLFLRVPGYNSFY